MADDNLDKYLEDIGINVGDEAQTPTPSQDDYPEEVSVLGYPLQMEGSPQERAESFLVNLLLNFDPAYAVEVKVVSETELYADIFGGDSGKIIGRNGRTLQALEYLSNAVLNRQQSDNIRVTIDVGGYKRRHEERLRDLARKAAERVRSSGQPYSMKPMNAAERRIIHMELADDPSVISDSSGEGRDRKVVVHPA